MKTIKEWFVDGDREIGVYSPDSTAVVWFTVAEAATMAREILAACGETPAHEYDPSLGCVSREAVVRECAGWMRCVGEASHSVIMRDYADAMLTALLPGVKP